MCTIWYMDAGSQSAPLTYTTLDSVVLDLTGLNDGERAFLESMIADYRAGAEWGDFARRVSSDENLALEAGRRITRAVLDHPLYNAVRDMEDRLGIAQGVLLPGVNDDAAIEPFDDEFLPVYDVAARLGITAKATYKAIESGRLIATGERPARVSRRSAEAYKVSRRHVKAGNSRATVNPASQA